MTTASRGNKTSADLYNDDQTRGLRVCRAGIPAYKTETKWSIISRSNFHIHLLVWKCCILIQISLIFSQWSTVLRISHHRLRELIGTESMMAQLPHTVSVSWVNDLTWILKCVTAVMFKGSVSVIETFTGDMGTQLTNKQANGCFTESTNWLIIKWVHKLYNLGNRIHVCCC